MLPLNAVNVLLTNALIEGVSMVHGLMTVVWLLFCYFIGLNDFFSTIPACFFIGREMAQAEQRVISQYYDNKRANAPWYCGFEKRAWTKKGLMDFIIPWLVTLCYSFII